MAGRREGGNERRRRQGIDGESGTRHHKERQARLASRGKVAVGAAWQARMVRRHEGWSRVSWARQATIGVERKDAAGEATMADLGLVSVGAER